MASSSHRGAQLDAPRVEHRIARGGRVAVAVVALAAAIAIAVLSTLGFETLKTHLDPFSVDRNADLTRAEFDDIVLRLRVVAGALAALAALLLSFGDRLDGLVSTVARSWWAAIRGLPRALRAWVSAERPWYVVSFGVVLAAAVVIRIAFDDVPMRYDEATTYDNFVSKPLYVALANYATPNNHLLNTLLAKVSVVLLGNAPWTVRLPALIAGIALVPATFALARVLYGRTAALLAAALVAASSTLVEYSTNARGYTLVALMTVIVFLAAARALERDSVGAWALVAVAGALGLYAVPVMLYPLGGAFVWLLASGLVARRPRRELLVRLAGTALAATTITLVLYAPVYAASGVRSVTSNEFVEPRSWGMFIDLLPEHFRDTFESWTRDLPSVVSFVLAVGLVAGLVLTPRISRFPIPPLLAIVVWTAPVLALQRVVPFTRVWLFLVPLALATAAALYGWLFERVPRGTRLGAALAAILAVGGSVLVLRADSVRESRETGALLDAPAIAAFLADRVEPGDRILATGSDTILQYYLGRDGVDAGPLLYTDAARPRTFVVVNVLGGQTIGELAKELAGSAEAGAPELLRSFPSGLVYLVRRPA